QWLPEALAADPRLREGVLNGEWSIDGTVAPGLDAALSLQLADSMLGGKPLAARLRSRIALEKDGAPRRLQDADADIRLGDNSMRAQGALGQPGDRLSFDVSLADPAAIEPRLEGKATLRGEL